MGLFGSKNLAEVLADRDAQIAELTTRVESAEATVGEKLEAIAAMEKVHADAIAKANADLEAARAEVAAKGKEIEAAAAKVAELEKKLAVPPLAYQHASEGVSEAVAEGGDGEAKSYWAQYFAIEDGAERTKFWRKHKQDLENEQRNAVKK